LLSILIKVLSPFFRIPLPPANDFFYFNKPTLFNVKFNFYRKSYASSLRLRSGSFSVAFLLILVHDRISHVTDEYFSRLHPKGR